MKLYLVPRTLKVRMILRSSVNLLIISVFFAIFIPSRMGDLLRRRMESRTTSITQLVAGAIASGIEFDDKQNVSDTLEGLRAVADFSYAVVTRANGTMLASVNP
ncbi:MAG TPA: CHASE sensor domain-containing protein, partial [Pseudomonadota bacterium]|nr:CHASE sensor domain-containing protein [Pseudomonadota bacterium]